MQLEKTNNGNIIWHKTFFNQRKEPSKNTANLLKEKPLGGGGTPISHTENSVPGSNRLSTPNGLSAGKGNTNSSTPQENNEEISKNNENSSGIRLKVDEDYMSAV